MLTATEIAANLAAMTIDELRATYQPAHEDSSDENRELARMWRAEVIRRNPVIGSLRADEILRG